MLVTGYQLMDRLEELREQAKTADDQFKGTLFQFKNDTANKLDPRALMQAYVAAEEKIARIQEVQAGYNLMVTVTVQDKNMTLERVVKLIGTAAHVKSQWKTASQDTPQTAYYNNPLARTKDAEYAERVVSVEECLQLADAASKRAAALKKAIRAGNATPVELDLDPDLFE